MIRALARVALRRERGRAVALGLFFALLATASARGYAASYPTVAQREGFAATFGANGAVRLFYGVPRDLASVAGFTAWRVGGMVAIAASVWAALAGARESRGEEDSGRADLILAMPVARGTLLAATVAALGGTAALVAVLLWIGLLAGGLPAGGSVYLALAAVSPAPVFAAVGLLAGQVAPLRARASALALGVVALAFAIRVVADTAGGAGWLRWLTPLGWSEELRAFTGARPAVLLLPAVATAALMLVTTRIAVRRDIGRGLLETTDRTAPRTRLLGSPTALALREQRGRLVAWAVGTGAFAVIVGLLSNSFSEADADLQRQLAAVGGGALGTAAGALGFYFLFFALAAALFAAAQVAAARHEEATGRLETLFAQPVARRRWLGGRLALATVAVTGLMLLAGALAWLGATLAGADVPLPDLLGAGLNTLPVALLFGAVATLAFALLPRATGALAYGLVGAAFAWELVGGLVGVPAWVRSLSPFHHLALVPAESFDATATFAMLALAAATAALAVTAFARRDLAGA